jgi:hypothetical protein
MTTLREAAQQALEALEWASDLNAVAQNHTPLHEAITALRAALTQPDVHPQCAQGCEFLAMEHRRNEREATLKESGFE